MPITQLTEMQFRALVEQAERDKAISKAQVTLVLLYNYGDPHSDPVGMPLNMGKISQRAGLQRRQGYNLLNEALKTLKPLVDAEHARLLTLPQVNNDTEEERFAVVLHSGIRVWEKVDSTAKKAIEKRRKLA